MALGEMEFSDLRYANGTEQVTFPVNEKGERIRDLEAEIYLGRMIFMAFAFLFGVVVMNLLNAIAIGDIQVYKND